MRVVFLTSSSFGTTGLNVTMAVGYWLLAFGPSLRCPARAVKCFASLCVDVRRSPCDVVALDRPKVKSPKPGAEMSHQGQLRRVTTYAGGWRDCRISSTRVT